MSRLLPPPFPRLQRGTECESDAVLCLVSCSGWKARKVNQRSVSQTLCLVSCSGWKARKVNQRSVS